MRASSIGGRAKRDATLARARNIKPRFFLNDDLAEVSPLGRLLFIALWTMADREGRLEDRSKRIKAEALPYDDCDVESLLSELAEREFILRYSRGDRRFIQIVTFAKHQNPHKHEPPSEIPGPDAADEGKNASFPTGAPGGNIEHSTSTIQAPDKHCARPVVSASSVSDSDFLIQAQVSAHSESMATVTEMAAAEAPEARPNSPQTHGPPGARCEHHTSTIQAPYKHRSRPADSGFLIPDSPLLIPEGERARSAPRDAPPGNAPSGGTAAARGCRIPDGFPTDAELAWCRQERPDLDAAFVGSKFRDYWLAVAGAKGRKLDWPATWRNFVRGEYARRGFANAGHGQPARQERISATVAALTGRNNQPETIDVTAVCKPSGQ